MTKQPAVNINLEMQRQAEEAVLAASKRFNTRLDYDENSLVELDKLLDQAWVRLVQLRSEDKLTDEIIKRTVQAWGSYFGEVVRRLLGGQWVQKEGDPALLFDQLEISPMEEVYERITDEPHYTMVSRYAEIAKKVPPVSHLEDTVMPPASGGQETTLASGRLAESSSPASSAKRRTWLLVGAAVLVVLLVACLATAISLQLLTL
jgi:hypothetical protein